MKRITTVVSMAATVLAIAAVQATAQDLPPVAAAVRAEALKPNAGPEGRPLPLVAHWHSADAPLDYQLELIARGHHILPFTYMLAPALGNDEKRLNTVTKPGMEAGLKKLAAWKMPFVLITGGQWEADLYSNPYFKNQPAEKNPCVVDATTGEIKNMVTPFGPVELWRELGRQWGGTRYFQWLAEIYPDPPKVILVSNNEAQCLRWHALETEKRYIAQYGPGRSDDFKRKLINDLYYERYRALFAGIREGLPNDAWRKAVVCVGYNAGPGEPHLGRATGMENYSGVIQEDLPPRNTWEGAIPEAYDNPWEGGKFDHLVWSCQIEMMNLLFRKKMALQADPEWWMESIFWNGGATKAMAYENKGLLYTPERYAAWAQTVLWILTPRVARQWNGASEKRDAWLPEFAALMRAVDLIHADPVLAKFWRKGELVVNPDSGHPYTCDFPSKWKNEDRWFRLSTDRDPPRPWTLTTPLPVFALARVVGAQPNREWLLYAHAPLGDLKAAKVTIPGYQTVSVDILLAGAYYHLREVDGAVIRVGRPDQLKYATNKAPEARDDNYAVVAGETLEVTPFQFSGGTSLLRNDTDYEGDPLTAVLEKAPKHGELTLKPDGTFSYRPKPGFEGGDNFTYRAFDGRDASQPATVTLRVLGKPVAIVDDASPHFNATAFPERSSALGFKGGITYFPANHGLDCGSTAKWTFTGMVPDTYEVFATWPEFSYQRPTNVPFEVFDGDTSRGKATANQETAPTGPEAEGVKWQSLGTFEIKSGTLRVELGNAAVGRWVIADAVRIVGRKTGKTVVIDDGGPGFTLKMGWNERKTGYAGAARWTFARVIPKTKAGEALPPTRYDSAVWRVEDLNPGNYELYATWPANSEGGEAVYEAYDGDKLLLRATASQASAPQDLCASGTWWQRLGTLKVTGAAIRIELVAKAFKGKPTVIADAVTLFHSQQEDAKP